MGCCVRSAQPDALLGIPAAIWIARVCRRSFRGVAHKIPVGRRFARRLSAYAAQGDYPLVDSARDELAAVLFTSGSTGPAKGVCYAHGMFLAQVQSIRAQYGDPAVACSSISR